MDPHAGYFWRRCIVISLFSPWTTLHVLQNIPVWWPFHCYCKTGLLCVVIQSKSLIPTWVQLKLEFKLSQRTIKLSTLPNHSLLMRAYSSFSHDLNMLIKKRYKNVYSSFMFVSRMISHVFMCNSCLSLPIYNILQ